MAGPVAGELVGCVLGGRFRLEALVGRGASAQVYLANDTRLRRRVAVKILHAGAAGDSTFLRRFRSEAQLAASLTHPNVLVIHDWNDGLADPTDPTSSTEPPSLVTEYLDGGSLRAILDDGHRLTLSQATLVGLDAARALAYAHRNGVVHRDIKPANLLFGADGRVRIGDFGLARALSEASWTEPTGGAGGTARYAAPEQARGRVVDGKADVYALVLTLIESITGSVPFPADTEFGIRMARLQGPIPVPEGLGPLAEALAPGGALEPDDRVDAAGLAELLERAARRLPRPTPIPLAVPIDLDRLVGIGADPTIHAGVGVGVDVGVDVDVDVASTRVADDAANDVVDLTGDPGFPATDMLNITPTFSAEVTADVTAEVTADVTERSAAASPMQTHVSPNAHSPGARRRWVWRGVAAVILVLVLVGGTVGYSWWKSRPVYTVIPLVAGQTLDGARTKLTAGKFVVRITRRRDEKVALNSVIEQSPAPGLRVKQKAAVALVLSDGPSPRMVPALNGLDEDGAKRQLDAQQLKLGTVTRTADETVPESIIISWSPQGEVARDSAVDVVVSSGPAPRIVPNISGMLPDEAKKALPDGLTGDVVRQSSEKVPAGTVIASNYKPGTALPRGASIRIIVSSGPALVKIPAVRGLDVNTAFARLRDAGFSVSGTKGSPDQPVVSTEPSEGKAVKKGTAITLITGPITGPAN